MMLYTIIMKYFPSFINLAACPLCNGVTQYLAIRLMFHFSAKVPREMRVLQYLPAVIENPFYDTSV